MARRPRTAGNLYGTITFGSAAGKGVVFKLSPGGTETVLYSFCSLRSCSDGADPQAGLIADRAGNLYGATANGGAGRGVQADGHGVRPVAGLIADSGCNLYGTRVNGGAGPGKGVVFKLSPGGTET